LLIIPLHRRPTWENFPLVTAVLILINVFVFAALQSRDDKAYAQAVEFYTSTGLPNFESHAYEDWLRAHNKSAKVAGFAKLMPAQQVLVIESDADFLKALDNDLVITPQQKNYQYWKDNRTKFEAMRDAAFTQRHMMLYAHFEPDRIFTAMFMHGGMEHLIGNMVFLALLGLLVEGALGSGWFLALYLLGGIGAARLALAGCGLPDGVPDNGPGPMVTGSFSSSYRRQDVGYAISYPPGHKPDLDLPVLVTLHGYDINTERQWWESGRGGFVLRQYPQGLLAMARDPRVHFIAVSHAIRERAIEVGIPPEKISVNYIGVDTRRFVPGGPPLAQRDEVLFVGRLVEKKGCRYLIEAFGQVQDRFPDARLVIVGTGPQEPRLHALAQQLGVRVEFPGSLSPREVRERLLRARVFCLPSITARNGDAEGLGIVLLEAQAAGVPVITSARGGAEEGIVHGSTGFAHAEKDVGALRDGLAALLGNDELATRFGLDGRRHVVEHMDIRDCVARLETIYDRHAAIYQPAAVSRPFAAEGTRLGT